MEESEIEASDAPSVADVTDGTESSTLGGIDWFSEISSSPSGTEVEVVLEGKGTSQRGATKILGKNSGVAVWHVHLRVSESCGRL